LAIERDLPGHEVGSVALIGWAGIENGILLERAQEKFDVLITMDSNIVRELDIQKLKLVVIVLRAPSNRLADTRPLMAKVLTHLSTFKSGSVNGDLGVTIFWGAHAPRPPQDGFAVAKELVSAPSPKHSFSNHPPSLRYGVAGEWTRINTNLL